MKNKIAIASAFLAASSFSMGEIVINDFLSFEGFVDMSYVHTGTETDDQTESDNSFAIDQVEVSWLFDFDPVTAQIDVQYEGGSSESDTNIEQAFVTYHMESLGGGAAITAGRYASMLGFEAFEPTGLYQYTTAYDINGAPVDSFNDLSIIPGYAQGIKFTYETDTTFFGLSFQDEAFGNGSGEIRGDEENRELDSTFAVEIAGAYYMDNGLSFFLGGAHEEGDGGFRNTWVINAYTTFETGAWIFAAEVNFGETDSGSFEFAGDRGTLGEDAIEEADALQALIMANFAYSDKASVTGRLSYIEFDSGITELGHEYLKYTLAHGYAFTDNLLLVTEISAIDGKRAPKNATEFDNFLVGAELLFTF